MRWFTREAVKQIAVKHHKHIQKGRTISEMIACVFVAIETHFTIFAIALAAWFVMDIFELLPIAEEVEREVDKL